MNLLAKICGATAVALSLFSAAASADTVSDIRERGTLRIPAILNEVPYFNKDPRTGEWTGFVIDMASDIAKTLDVELEVVESSWSNAILDVQSGKVDMAFAVTATPVRAVRARACVGDVVVPRVRGDAPEIPPRSHRIPRA